MTTIGEINCTGSGTVNCTGSGSHNCFNTGERVELIGSPGSLLDGVYIRMSTSYGFVNGSFPPTIAVTGASASWENTDNGAVIAFDSVTTAWVLVGGVLPPGVLIGTIAYSTTDWGNNTDNPNGDGGSLGIMLYYAS